MTTIAPGAASALSQREKSPSFFSLSDKHLLMVRHIKPKFVSACAEN